MNGGNNVREYVLNRQKDSKPEFLRVLDEEQYNAVVNSAGNTLVIAGPGSGKTRVITSKVALLLENGIIPEKIMLVTFTKAAAKEMLKRAEELTGKNLRGILSGTFHHVANYLLRIYGDKIGIDKNFTILDTEDAEKLMKLALNQIKEKGSKLPTAKQLLRIHSYMQNTMSDAFNAVRTLSREFLTTIDIIERIFENYRYLKKECNSLDYDDLLLEVLRLLDIQEVRESISNRFEWILVDEFQDTNLPQLQFLKKLSTPKNNLFIVADDSQSIYSFRGARFENVKDLLENSQIFKIQTNYRSSERIVDLINAIIPSKSIKKQLKAVRNGGEKPFVVFVNDFYDEALFIAETISVFREEGYSLSDIAVLYRIHSHSIELQAELAKQGIPFKVMSGLKFVETTHAKDVFAYLKVLQNPYDRISWLRLLQLGQGVGEGKASKIIDTITKTPEPLEEFLNMNFKEDDLNKIKDLINRSKELTVSEKIEVFYEEFYKDYAETNFDNYSERLEDIEMLIELSNDYDSVEEFLTDMLFEEEATFGQEFDEKVTLTTIHQAKGLEWKVVFVLEVCPGDFPHSFAINEGNYDEEERLFYVAVSRAKDFLYLMRPELSKSKSRYYSYNVHDDLDFIDRIPPHLVEFIRVR